MISKRYLPFALIGGVFALVMAGGATFYIARQRAIPPPAPVASGKPGAEPPHVRGSAKVPVHLEEFGDYQCPPCAALAPVLKQIEKDYGSRVRITFRQYPLSSHKHALAAARAAEASGMQDRFWEMHDLLYESNWLLSRTPDAAQLLERFAQSLKLDLERFRKDFASEQVNSRIAADRERAKSLGVDRTPIVFINNRRLAHESLTVAGLHKEIDAALGGPPRQP